MISNSHFMNSGDLLQKINNINIENKWLSFGWLFEFYGISTFVGYLTPNPFLWK